jgi:hypothetical protein
MRPFIAVIDLLLWLVQGLLMLVFVVPLQRTAQALTWVSWKVIRWPYYRGIVLTRRRLTGRPLWQDSDMLLGIQAPPSEVERLSKAVADTDLKEETYP